MNRFHIDAYDFEWITGLKDDPTDKCLHGRAVVVIGDEVLEDTCTVSATALYLLKSLTDDKTSEDGYLMLPCCGHFYISNEDMTEVYISGCDLGTDWEIRHTDGGVRLILENGKEEFVDMEEYKREVFRFCDNIKAYYDSCSPKVFGDDKDDFNRRGYTAFWNEWNSRRYGV